MISDTGGALMIAERFTAQLLSGPRAADPVGVARRLLAVQAQDPRGARLAIRARSEGATARDVDRALSDDRSLVIDWLNRGTLHLVCSEDHGWLHALTTPPLVSANARRLAQEGVAPSDAERAVVLIGRSLAQEGPLTRMQLRERIAAAGIRTERQALVHLMMLATLRGVSVRGPMIGREHAFALRRDWLGASPPFDRELALAELARRYLGGHGPADDRDLARWAGLPLRDARAGLRAIASELAEVPGGLVDLAARSAPAELPPPRLLGPFDPLLLGWRSREPILGPHERRVVGNGLFRAVAIVRGRAVATWRVNDGAVTIEPFGKVSGRDWRALERDAADVERFLRVAPAAR